MLDEKAETAARDRARGLPHDRIYAVRLAWRDQTRSKPVRATRRDATRCDATRRDAMRCGAPLGPARAPRRRTAHAAASVSRRRHGDGTRRETLSRDPGFATRGGGGGGVFGRTVAVYHRATIHPPHASLAESLGASVSAFSDDRMRPNPPAARAEGVGARGEGGGGGPLWPRPALKQARRGTTPSAAEGSTPGAVQSWGCGDRQNTYEQVQHG
jgi:hypothetical protein